MAWDSFVFVSLTGTFTNLATPSGNVNPFFEIFSETRIFFSSSKEQNLLSACFLRLGNFSKKNICSQISVKIYPFFSFFRIIFLDNHATSGYSNDR